MDVLSEALTAVRMTGAHPHPHYREPTAVGPCITFGPTATTIQTITMSVNT